MLDNNRTAVANIVTVSDHIHVATHPTVQILCAVIYGAQGLFLLCFVMYFFFFFFFFAFLHTLGVSCMAYGIFS
jgi:hypothetical protein